MTQRRRFLLFVLIGGLASGVNFVARILWNLVTSFEVAVLLAFPVALTTAFLLNRLFVFPAGAGSWNGQFWRFFLVNLAVLVQVFVISVLLERLIFPSLGLLWHADEIAHAIGLITPIFTSYVAHSRYSFAPARPAEAADEPA